MATLVPYMNFYGRCTEAMNFYKDIFGGELSIQKSRRLSCKRPNAGAFTQPGNALTFKGR
jgi:uncharacterized glyoxalase superfamily protein PhnB